MSSNTEYLSCLLTRHWLICELWEHHKRFPWTLHHLYLHLPEEETGTSAAGDPNQREMKLRFWGADTADTARDWWCSGDWADDSTVGVAAPPTAAKVRGGGGEDADTDGDCGSIWEGMGGWGVLGLELPVEAPLGGTTGDWEPEEEPLAGPGEP